MSFIRAGLSGLAVAVALLGLPILQAAPALAAEAAQEAHPAHPNVVSDDPADWTPHVPDGAVFAVAEVGNTVIIGGRFSGARNNNATNVLPQPHLFALDTRTGKVIESFRPELDGHVNSVAVSADGRSVYVGGAFSTVNGKTSRRLAHLSLADGSSMPGFRAPAFDGLVHDVKLSRGQLYVAGTWQNIGGIAQPALAAVDPATGAVSTSMQLQLSHPARGGILSVKKLDITSDGSKLVALGNFGRISGQVRDQLAMINLASTASLAEWATSRYAADCSSSFDSYVRDVALSPDGSYFIVVASGAYAGGPPNLCDTAARWETDAVGTGVQPTWVNYTGGDTFLSAAVSGTAVYVGGHQRWVNNPFAANREGPGAVARDGIAALDPVNGLPLAWNPGRSRGVGVHDILLTPTGMWMGSDTDFVAGEYHQKISFMPLAGGAAVPPSYADSLPGEVYVFHANGDLLHRSCSSPEDCTNTLVSDTRPWENQRGSFMVSGTLYEGRSNGAFLKRSYDGERFGAAETVDLNGLSDFATELQTVTGMFYDDGRLYYTIADQSSLYYRYFTPESDTVGAERFRASTSSSWAGVRGMFLSDDEIFVADGLNSLYAMDFNDGAPTGIRRAVDSPLGWTARGIVVVAEAGYDPRQPNEAPTAAFPVPTCDEAECSFDASASSDADGVISSFHWDFGDGATSSVVTPVHTYAEPGAYAVTLTVVDDDGAAHSTTRQVDVAGPPENQPPVAGFSFACPDLTCAFTDTSTDDDGTVVSHAWDFGDGSTSTDADPAHTYAEAGTYTVTLTVTDDDGTTGSDTEQVEVTDSVTGVTFRGGDFGNFPTRFEHVVTAPAALQAGDAMLLISTTSYTAEVTGISGIEGWTLLDSSVGPGSITTRVWQKVATAGDAGKQVTLTLGTGARGDLQLLAYAGADPTLPVASFAYATEDVSRAEHTTPGVEVDVAGSRVVSYWADKSGATNAWTAPASSVERFESVPSSLNSLANISGLSAETGPHGPGPIGGLTATANAATSHATMWTIVLSPDGATDPEPQQPPVASFTASCTDLTCAFTDGSTDADGTIASHAWDFGDGQTSTQASPSHTYAAAGSYSVGLRVTDDDGSSDTATETVTVTEPDPGDPDPDPTGEVTFRDSVATAGTSSYNHSVQVPATVAAGDALVLFHTTAWAVEVTEITGVTGWTLLEEVTGINGITTRAWYRVADGTEADQQLQIRLAGSAKADVTLLAYDGTDTTTPVAAHAAATETTSTDSHTTPEVDVTADSAHVVSYWADKTSTTTGWTPPAGPTERTQVIGIGGGRISSLSTDAPAVTGPTGGLTASTDAATSHATMWTIVLSRETP